jgi:AraC-like DNA-binding protein
MKSAKPYRSTLTAGSSLTGDPLAAAIGLLRPLAVNETSLHAAGSWAVGFGTTHHVELGVVARGECWITLEEHDPLLLSEGDFFLLGNPPPYVLASALTEKPLDAEILWGGPTRGAAHIGPADQEDTYLCGGHFSFDDANAGLLLDLLPPLVYVRADDPRGQLLTHLSALLVAEVESTDPGSSLILDHLAQTLFIHMLRAHADNLHQPAGWMAALNKDGIGTALRTLHADISHRWTLQELAEVSHMSRSAFAATFKARVGSAPLEYLIQWRMSVARDALRRQSMTITELATAIGYESESAFSTAFRRVVGISPAAFRKEQTTAAAA